MTEKGMRWMICVVLSVLMIALMSCAPDASRPASEPFFGLENAGDTPALLAEGFLSTELSERDGCFSQDGKEFYYTVWSGSFGTILSMRLLDGGWTDPEVVSFAGQYSDLEPCIAPDGNRLYFASNRPLDGSGEPKDYDIWYVEKKEGFWGKPVNVGAPVNTEKNEFYPSVTANGTLYVTGRYEGSMGGEDIFRFEMRDGGFAGPENVGPSVNSERDEFNAFVSADEEFVLFSSFGRSDGQGGGDLYVSIRSDDGSWAPARNLGPTINSTALDYCPWVSTDGSLFVFSSRRQAGDAYWKSKRTREQLLQSLRSTENGSGDIYVVNGRSILKEQSVE